jgi:hypothetical protein
MAADVTASPSFKAGHPKTLFAAPIWGGGAGYDVTADGQKFLINSLESEGESTASAAITVVLNWQAGLKK